MTFQVSIPDFMCEMHVTDMHFIFTNLPLIDGLQYDVSIVEEKYAHSTWINKGQKC